MNNQNFPLWRRHAIFLSLVIVFGIMLVVSINVTSNNPLNIRFSSTEQNNNIEKIQQLTSLLLTSNVSERKLPGNTLYSTQNALLEIAKSRQLLLVRLAEENPQAFMTLALKKEAKEQLPKHVQPYIESEVEVEGVLHTTTFDSANKEITSYNIESPTEKFSFYPTANASGLTGSELRIRGYQLNNALVAYCCESGGPVQPLNIVVPPVENSTGEQKVIIIMVNFSNLNPGTSTPEYIADLMFNSETGVNAFYQEFSYGKTFLTGNVVGWYQIPSEAQPGCQLGNFFQDAIEVADPDVYFPDYNRLILIIPPDTPCWWAGSAGLLGHDIQTDDGIVNLTYAVIRVPGTWIMAHEFGHQFALLHSDLVDCKNLVFSDACEDYNYLFYDGTVQLGDTVDVMGSGASGHFNAAQKKKLGWITEDEIISLDGPEDSGIYTIGLLENSTTAYKAIEMVRKVHECISYYAFNFQGVCTNSYYIEYRQPVGFDSNFLAGTQNLDGALLHVFDRDWARTFLLDATPADNLNTDPRHLPEGSTFIGPEGIQITTLNHDATSLTVEVIIPPNLIPNGSFEDGQTDWNGWGSSKELVTDVVLHGDYAAKITHAGSANRVLRHDKTFITPGTTYEITGNMKTENVTGDGAFIRLQWNKQNGATIQKNEFGTTVGTKNWTTYTSGLITAPPDAVKLRIDLIASNGDGISYFDDIRLREVE